MNIFLSKFLSAYRKSYCTNHVLIRLIENWKKSLDERKFVGAALMNLSKAFDSMHHDLLIAKMYAYGFSMNVVTFFYSYSWRISSTFIWSFPRLNSWSTSFQYIYKWSISLDYKNRPVKFCWSQYYKRSWKNYWKPYFHTWNRSSSHYWLVQVKWNDCQSREISGHCS